MSPLNYMLRVMDIYRQVFLSPSSVVFLVFLLVLWKRPKHLLMPNLGLVVFYWLVCWANLIIASLLIVHALLGDVVGVPLQQIYVAFWVLKMAETVDTIIRVLLSPSTEVTFLQLHFHFAVISLGDLATRVFVNSPAFVLPMITHCISELLGHCCTMLTIVSGGPSIELGRRVLEIQSVLFSLLLIIYAFFDRPCVFVVLYVLTMVHKCLTTYVIDYLMADKEKSDEKQD